MREVFGNQLLAIALIALTAVPIRTAHAHQLGQSYVFLHVFDDRIEGRLEITVADLNTVLGLDFRTDGSVTLEEIEPHIIAIKAYLEKRVKMAPNGVAEPLDLGAHELMSLRIAQYVSLPFEFKVLERAPDRVDVEYRVLFDVVPDHRGFLVVEHDWKTGTFNDETNVALIFGPDDTRQVLDLSSSSVWRGVAAMIGLGVHHIWVGIDHILFLLALLLPSVEAVSKVGMRRDHVENVLPNVFRCGPPAGRGLCQSTGSWNIS